MVFGVDQPVGRPKGVLNKDTRDFKQAVNNLLEYAAPKMVEWVDSLAVGIKDENDKFIVNPNPDKALSHVAGLAEYIYPKLSRAENINKSVGIVQIVLEAAKQQGLVTVVNGEAVAADAEKLLTEQPLEPIGLPAIQTTAIGAEGAKESK